MTYHEIALRWSPAGMIAAGCQSNRVKGYRQPPHLARALEREIGYQPDDHDIAADITA